MADLEDFFAKRDKKKSSKKKFDTAEDVAKILEAKTKQKKELETGKSNYLAEGRQSPGPGLPVGGDDEWMEAEEKKPDFSNLKIQELVLESDDEEEQNQEGKENEEGSADGPWKKKAQAKANEEEKEKLEKEKLEKEKLEKEKLEKEKETPEESEESKEKSEEKPEGEGGDSDGSSKEGKKESEDGPKKYVPPSMRNKMGSAASGPPSSGPSTPREYIPAGSAASGAYVPPSRRGTQAEGPSLAPMKQKKGAPTLEDEELFPTLS